MTIGNNRIQSILNPTFTFRAGYLPEIKSEIDKKYQTS